MKNQNYRLFLQTAANAIKKASQSERIPAFFALTSSAACKKSGDSYIYTSLRRRRKHIHVGCQL
ncbi:hypothetical protein [Anaerotruncus colihominis]|uniref:hypothetical protein n=1 Tax=Anaerotruncus colihominis TaxID=169435 RepID=UPI002671F652|nr:hypothetical protein [Anaerotruncus colihominis]